MNNRDRLRSILLDADLKPEEFAFLMGVCWERINEKCGITTDDFEENFKRACEDDTGTYEEFLLLAEELE